MPAAFASVGDAKWRSAPSKMMRPALGCHAAGDDLDQRRFAGAVVAEERDNLAATDGEADAAQRFDGAEMLGDALKPEQRRGNTVRLLAYAHRACAPLGSQAKTEALHGVMSNPDW